MKTAQLQLIIVYFTINMWILLPTIIHCVDKEKHIWRRTLWLLDIVLLNLPGVVFYWLAHKRISSSFAGMDGDFETDKHIIFTGLMFTYEFISIPLIANNSQNNFLVANLIVVLILAFVNHFVLAAGQSVLNLLIPIVQVISIVGVNLLASSDEFKISIIIVVVSILNEYPISYSRKFVVFPLVIFLGSTALFMYFAHGASLPSIAVYVIRNSITYLLVVGAFYVGRKQIMLNNQLYQMTRELRETNRKLEEISIVKERNRIAREIHDTLGHTLTGGIIQLEAAKKLIHIDQEKTLEAIEKTQQITRDGLLEVKRAIHTLRPVFIEDGNLKDALEALFEKVEKDFHVQLERSISVEALKDDAIKVSIYRIIQESITNSIRHGEADKVNILVEDRGNSIELMIQDDGNGASGVHEGFGLKGIRERVESHDGQLQIFSNTNAGFQLQVSIPK